MPFEVRLLFFLVFICSLSWKKPPANIGRLEEIDEDKLNGEELKVLDFLRRAEAFGERIVPQFKVVRWNFATNMTLENRVKDAQMRVTEVLKQSFKFSFISYNSKRLTLPT